MFPSLGLNVASIVLDVLMTSCINERGEMLGNGYVFCGWRAIHKNGDVYAWDKGKDCHCGGEERERESVQREELSVG